MYKEITCCRACGSLHIEKVLSLGNMAVSDFVDKPEIGGGVKAPLELVICDQKRGGCGLLQLRHTVSKEIMYRHYWYQSGINSTMTEELRNIAEEGGRSVGLSSGDYVIDIGANDGTLLRGYKVEGLKTIGFEPAENLYKRASESTEKIIVEFFNYSAWEREFGKQEAKIITAIGMFYDLDDPGRFLADIRKCLAFEGVFIVQMMYMPCALERNAFDGICHEHLEYYTLESLERLLAKHHLEVFDVKMREEINEGSARFFIRKKGSPVPIVNNDGALERVQKLRDTEKKLKLDELVTYSDLAERIKSTREKTLCFLHEEKVKGKKIHGYAASTKGNTTLQYYGIKDNLIDVIADRNPAKWGKYTVCSGIPIVSEEESRVLKPDYYFVLAWHFLKEFKERERAFLERGGKFIVPMPDFMVVSDEGRYLGS